MITCEEAVLVRLVCNSLKAWLFTCSFMEIAHTFPFWLHAAACGYHSNNYTNLCHQIKNIIKYEKNRRLKEKKNFMWSTSLSNSSVHFCRLHTRGRCHVIYVMSRSDPQWKMYGALWILYNTNRIKLVSDKTENLSFPLWNSSILCGIGVCNNKMFLELTRSI